MQSAKFSGQHQLINRSALITLIFLLHFTISSVFSLQCRSDDGLSDGELKVIARRCMRKIGGNSYMPGHNNDNSKNDDGAFDTRRQQKQRERQQQQEQQQRGGGGFQNRNNNYNNNNEDAHDDYTDDNDNEYNGYMMNNNNNNDNNNRNNHNYNRDQYHNFENSYISDAWGQRNRERIESQQRLESPTGSSGSSSSNNDGNARGRTNGDNTGDANNQTKYPYNNNNFYNNNNNKNNNNNNNDKSKNNSFIDSACIVHCFFNEMNMLNQENYPDRHKVTYILTKDLRNHELRSFYIETVEECFHYLESQRHLANRCQYSRNLINCMTEYARINCDDWDNHNLIFN